MTSRNRQIEAHLNHLLTRPFDLAPRRAGLVTSYDGFLLEAAGIQAKTGTICRITHGSESAFEAEVIGFRHNRCLLMSLDGSPRLGPHAHVTPLFEEATAQVGPELLGRVIDGRGRPLDGQGMLQASDRWPLFSPLQNPLSRASVTQALDTGVRAINGLLTLGRGQRVGIIAGSGVGKSVLLGMMARHMDVDIVVVGLIGERSREVSDFLTHQLAGDQRSRAVIVAVPANHPAILRVRAAERATSIAEYFRAKGKSVLLILDSLTRVAHAQREIGLALGEQPTSKGYPPSVLSLLPQLIERAGNDATTGGAITGIYTVLADGDDTVGDPIVDSARAILDGHIILSRARAERGIYPAIDLGKSISRVMSDIVTPDHLRAASRARGLASLYEENRDLFLLGAYQAGNNPDVDEAVRVTPALEAYMRQASTAPSTLADSISQLFTAVSG
jgi:flagellum-specific ATP synthase